MEPIDEEDTFLGKYQPSELKIASEFLTTWLPFLSRDLCHGCVHVLSDRIRSLDSEHCSNIETVTREDSDPIMKNMESEETNHDMDDECDVKFCDSYSLGSLKASDETASPPKTSWADMAQEDVLEEEEEEKQSESGAQDVDVSTSIGDSTTKTLEKRKLSREEREQYRFRNVKRMKVFTCFERVEGKRVNILEGLELHTGDILFGSNLKILGPGEFSGSYSIPLPVGKMDESKRPVGFTPEPDLQGIKPLPYEQTAPSTPAAASISGSSSRSSNGHQDGGSNNNQGAHREGSRRYGSRGYRSESREFRSSSSQSRGNSRPDPKTKVNTTSSDNVEINV
ncbi:unnamed protein product [Thlaspi arvense]|uniref:Uncharacterized protein n=1 Tax=Thlaspi arvense TaxID=13288 RepID=A0AAU9T188_THLAR|nr:unnamed protein product [Thlaspi arvense]